MPHRQRDTDKESSRVIADTTVIKCHMIEESKIIILYLPQHGKTVALTSKKLNVQKSLHCLFAILDWTMSPERFARIKVYAEEIALMDVCFM